MELALRGSNRSSAAQQIYEQLRQQIVALTLEPGSVLSKKEIADAFRVSQTPVREALIRLEKEGLIEIYPQSRTVVSFIDVQSAREAHFLRVSVEVEIARSLAAKITQDELKDLHDLIDQQTFALKRDDLSAFTESDNQFHNRMYDIAGVRGLWDLVDSRRAHLDRLRRLHLPSKGKAKSIIRDHKAIVMALDSGNPKEAERAVRRHLDGTVSSTQELKSLFPEYFGSGDKAA
ncbi:MAG: GntR family transcriptional regulator [Methyloligellaceae bacterium]